MNFDTKKWTEMTVTQSADGYKRYLFKYVGGNSGVLKNGNTTEPLFTKATLKNIKPNDGETWTADKSDIVVEAHAIQAEGFANVDAAWNAYNNQAK